MRKKRWKSKFMCSLAVFLTFALTLTALATVQAQQGTLPVLYNPFTPNTQQKFTPAERQSLDALIRSLNARRTRAVQMALGNVQDEWCSAMTPEDALLSFTAPFRNSRPEKLEVVLACAGEHGGVTLTFTQDGKRTTYLIPPELHGGGMWGIRAAFTVRDINVDGRRELALITHGGSDVSSSRHLTLLSFDTRGPRLLGEFAVSDRSDLPTQDGGGGEATILRVAKATIPIVYAYKHTYTPVIRKWKATGEIKRTALVINPINFMVWP
ncbi:hypothetical protein [Deinococcus cavernae]|nr:hypothetical protein [Deinococcus cavernae]